MTIPFSAKTVEAYKDPTLTFAERAADLVSRMTLEEKQAQMGDDAPAISRLGVSSYRYWNEAVHGIAGHGLSNEVIVATSFPVSFSMTSSWDVVLMSQIANAISNEARGYADKINKPLSYWSPTINMSRDPRWGRNEESYGEDPFLTSSMAGRFAAGLQGTQDNYKNPNTGEQYLKTMSTIKHYAANNSEFNRHGGNSEMDNRTLRNYYTWAFMDITQKYPIACAMTAYNRVNGIPSSASNYLIDDLLRKTWGFNGHVVSDCWAIKDIVNEHKWQPAGWSRPVNTTEAVAFSIKAGTDLECGDLYVSDGQVLKSLNQGLITEDDINQALVRIFTNRMRTGEFDPPSMVPYTNIKQNAIEAQAHRDIALQSAREAIILLQNKPKSGTSTNILPINLTGVNSIAVYGPMAKACDLGDDWYIGNPSERVSFWQGLQTLLAQKGYSGTLKYYDGVTPGVGVLPNYIFNMRSAKFGSDLRSAMTADDHSDGMNMCDNSCTNVGNIKPGMFMMFKNVNITNLQSVTLNTAAPREWCVDSRIKVRVGSVDGPIIAYVLCEPTGNPGDWSIYKDFTTTDINLNGLSGLQNIYLIFDPKEAIVNEEEVDKAAEADIAIVYTGSSGGLVSGFKVASEENDRKDLRLPAYQDSLIAKVARKNPNTIAVMQSAGIHDVSSFKNNVKAITYNSYNGQYQGTALAETLFGDNNPSGRLPVTWYKDNSQIPDIANYNIKAGSGSNGRTYMHFTGDVEYPFGYGLSYTTFTYSNVALSASSVAADGKFNVTLDVMNTGTRKGAEVVQVYIGAPDADTNPDVPAKQLKGFGRVELNVGETKQVTIPMNVSEFSMVRQDDGVRQVLAGGYKIYVAKSSNDPGQTMKTITVTAVAPKLQVVTLRGAKIVAAPNTSFASELTLAMSDESFYNLSSGGATVNYSSNNLNVATVNQSGNVTTVGGGVATIKASVTINGVTVEGSFPVAVTGDPIVGKPDLIITDITWTPVNPQTGDHVVFSANIKNQGQTATPNAIKHGVSFHIGTIGNNATWSDTHSGSLAPGQEIILTANGGGNGNNYWICGLEGNYNIIGWVNDNGGVFEESDMTNNQFTKQLTVSGPTSISETDTHQKNVFVKDKQLYINGYPSSASFAVYNLQGQKITEENTINNANRVSLYSGVFVVKVQNGDKSDRYKVLVE